MVVGVRGSAFRKLDARRSSLPQSVGGAGAYAADVENDRALLHAAPIMRVAAVADPGRSVSARDGGGIHVRSRVGHAEPFAAGNPHLSLVRLKLGLAADGILGRIVPPRFLLVKPHVGRGGDVGQSRSAVWILVRAAQGKGPLIGWEGRLGRRARCSQQQQCREKPGSLCHRYHLREDADSHHRRSRWRQDSAQVSTQLPFGSHWPWGLASFCGLCRIWRKGRI